MHCKDTDTVVIPIATNGIFMARGVRIEVSTYLDEPTIGEVAMLVEHAVEQDGVRPLSDQSMLQLLNPRPGQQLHICAWESDPRHATLVGYAHVDLSDPTAGASAELVVLPSARRRGVADALLDRAITESAGPVQLWAHGSHPGAARLAESRGFTMQRRLIQMRRKLGGALPAPKVPPGILIRTFDAARDSFSFLALNARAFTELPDQGNWGAHDLRSRIASDWFDPQGFILAFAADDDGNEGAMVGFHWTKVHAAVEPGSPDIGEIYVLAVDPDSSSKGLGRALAILGLDYLKNRGLTEAMLYVDSNNPAAIKLYTNLGFQKSDEDVLYRRLPGLTD